MRTKIAKRQMKKASVEGIHIAEPAGRRRSRSNVFWNTSSLRASSRRGCSRPTWLGARMKNGCRRTPRSRRQGALAIIPLEQPGGDARVRTIPSAGPAISARDPQRSISMHQILGRSGRRRAKVNPADSYASTFATTRSCRMSDVRRRRRSAARPMCSTRSELVDGGIDELSVSTGTTRIQYWFGSQFRRRGNFAPYQNATGLPGDLGGTGSHELGTGESGHPRHRPSPTRWITAAVSEVQKPYLGPVKGSSTDWTPLEGTFPEDLDELGGSPATFWCAERFSGKVRVGRTLLSLKNATMRRFGGRRSFWLTIARTLCLQL